MNREPFKITLNGDDGFDPFDHIDLSNSMEAIVIRSVKISGVTEITCIPWRSSKYKLVNYFRFLLIRIKLFLNLYK